MDQFPSNSRRPERAREEPKKVERVVQGEVVRRKTPLGRRMTQNLIGGDAQSVWGYMFGEVLVPAARDMIADALTGGVERAIFGDSAGRHRGRSRGHAGRTDYHSISNRGSRTIGHREEPRRELSRRSRATHNFDEIILENRVDAEEVLDRMDAWIDKYDVVSVAEFYELCGISGNYTDQKYGWDDIRGASIHRTRGGGWLIKMPPPEPLD